MQKESNDLGLADKVAFYDVLATEDILAKLQNCEIIKKIDGKFRSKIIIEAHRKSILCAFFLDSQYLLHPFEQKNLTFPTQHRLIYNPPVDNPSNHLKISRFDITLIRSINLLLLLCSSKEITKKERPI